jgi:hypothetical protein
MPKQRLFLSRTGLAQPSGESYQREVATNGSYPMSETKAARVDRKFEGVCIRTEREIDARLDALALALSKRAAGVAVKRGSAAKAALLRGLDAIEHELGLVSR